MSFSRTDRERGSKKRKKEDDLTRSLSIDSEDLEHIDTDAESPEFDGPLELVENEEIARKSIHDKELNEDERTRARRLYDKICLSLINRHKGFEEVIQTCASELYEIVVTNELSTREIVGKLEGKGDEIDKLSYAVVAASEKLESRALEPGTLILSSDMLTQEEIETNLKENIDPNGTDIDIQGITKTKRGEVIIRSRNKEMAEKIEKTIRDNEKMGKIKTRLSSKKYPRKIIYNVDKTVDKEEILENLKRQMNTTEEIRIINKQERRRGNNWIFEISPMDYSKNKERKRVCIGWESVPLKDYFSIMQCYKCGEIGHRKMDCKNGETCYKCGVPGHKAENCRNGPGCINCKKENLKYGRSDDIDHNCWDDKCKAREYQINKQKRITNYGS